MALNHRQELFAQEYIVDLNATQAAIRAGYSSDTAGQQGHDLLKKPEIQESIQKAMDLRAARTQITADRVLVELAKMGFADVRDMFTDSDQIMSIKNLPNDIAAAIQSIEIVTKPDGTDEEGNRSVEYVHKIKLADKKSSLELLGKHLKLFADRVEHTGKDGGAIELKEQPVSDRDLARRIAFILTKATQADSTSN
jgi:phage terminase small subunit